MKERFVFSDGATVHDYRGWAAGFRNSNCPDAELALRPHAAGPGSTIGLEICIAVPRNKSLRRAHLVTVLPFPCLRNRSVLDDGIVRISDSRAEARFNWPVMEIMLSGDYAAPELKITIPRLTVPMRPGLLDPETFVKIPGGGGFQSVGKRQQFEVADAPADALRIYASSNFSGGKVRFSIAAEQPEANHFMPDRGCRRVFQVEVGGRKSRCRFTARDQGIKKIDIAGVDLDKTFAVKAFFVSGNTETDRIQLFPQFMRDDDSNIFFGDLHAHSRESDGTGGAEELMRYARDWKRLDFFALNEHIEQRLAWTNWDADKWLRIKQINDEFNQDGEFVTIPGFEYRSYCNLWCFDDEYIKCIGPEFYGDDAHPVALPDGAPGAQELQQAIQETIKRFAMKKNWLAGYHRLETMLKIFGKAPEPVHLLQLAHGKRPPETGSEIFLERGDIVGFFGATDTHIGIPGQVFSGPHDGQSGLTAVIAPVLSRSALHNALRAGNCYATMGSRTLVRFELNGQPMGTRMQVPGTEPVNIKVRAAGKEIIDRVEVIRGGKAVADFPVGKPETFINWRDTESRHDIEYYFARIHLADKRMIWTSPVYILGGKA